MTVQIGSSISSGNIGAPIPTSRLFLEFYAGRVYPGQYWDRTELHALIGLAHNW